MDYKNNFFDDLDEKMKKDWKLRWYYRWECLKLDIDEWARKMIGWFRIPRGMYCTRCPYWENRPQKYNAYCRYMNQDDIDIGSRRKFTDVKTGEELNYEDMPPGAASLLWDGCKECDVKDW